MPKLHELLAVEGQLKGQAQATRTDLRATFSNKRHLFEEKSVTFKPKAEGEAQRTESQSDIQTTVRKELDWIAGVWSKALDTSYNVAEGNTVARADVVLDDGTVLFKGCPATALLELEKRAGEVLDLLRAVPTLDPAKGFRLDADRTGGIYKAREVTKYRTKKVQTPVTLAAATVEHPAQVQLVPEDVVIGDVMEQEWSGLVTPAEKGDLIERAEALQRAVKAARTRANAVDLTGLVENVGKKIFDFVFDNKK